MGASAVLHKETQLNVRLKCLKMETAATRKICILCNEEVYTMSYVKNYLYDVQEFVKAKLDLCLEELVAEVCKAFPEMFDINKPETYHAIIDILHDVIDQLEEEES